MRILYGIQTTGLGHLSRSLKVIKSLERRGFSVDIVSSGPHQEVYRLNSKHYTGFSFMRGSGGEIDLVKTLLNQKISRLWKDIRDFPKVDYRFVVSDFEPITSWVSKVRDLPLVSLSNQSNFLSKNFRRPPDLLSLSEEVMRGAIPFGKPIGLHWKPFDNFIYKPIIRDEISLQTQMVEEDYYLIYINNMTSDEICKILKKFTNQNFIVYLSQKEPDKCSNNIKIKQLNFKSFTRDLISCKGVISNSGFSTITESIYLGKKLMSIPQKNQWEQICNANDLAGDGFFIGDSLDNLDEFIRSEGVTIPRWSDPTEDIVDEILLQVG